jgi:hypothetical protein
LHVAAVGNWFHENRTDVMVGAILSLLPIYAAARPHNSDQWLVLGFGLGAIAPGGFYLPFLLARIWDLLRTVRRGVTRPVVRRLLPLCFLVLPCAAGVSAGFAILGFSFGWRLVAVVAFLVLLNLACLRFVKLPTADGAKLLTEIAGFRQFLQSVEKKPMDRKDAPSHDGGVYEKYLPYAVALEVEQAWSDRHMALAATVEGALSANSRSYHLGMYAGKPVEIVIGPDRHGGPPLRV